jgi:hypothetical protein
MMLSFSKISTMILFQKLRFVMVNLLMSKEEGSIVAQLLEKVFILIFENRM